MSTIAFAFSPAYLVLGVSTGLIYGLLAVGLILVYRSSRFLNFAHGEIGAFGAVVLSSLVRRAGVPYLVAVPVAIALSAGLGALSEALIVRRLRNAPRLMGMVATLGYAQFLVIFSVVISVDTLTGARFPEPPGFPSFTIDNLPFGPAHSATLLLTPLVLIGLNAFLRRTRFGLALQASAANPDAALMAGLSPTRMATLAWALAGAMSALTAILFFPTRGLTIGESLGPYLLLRALACASLARMNDMPRALLAGVAIGVVEQLVLANVSEQSFADVLLFAVILVALLAMKGTSGREREPGSWVALQPWPAIPEHLRKVAGIRNLGWVTAGVALAVGALAPAFLSFSATDTMTRVLALAMVGLSLTIVTGNGGQLSLGQFAVAATGAVVSVHVASATGNFFAAFVLAGLTSAAFALLVGLPALRLRGMLLAVSTLAFAATMAWSLQQPWAFGAGNRPGRPVLGPISFEETKPFYYFVLVVFVLAMLMARNVRRSGFGRTLTAVRDNEDAARAFTIGVTRVKLQGFAVAGAVAGLGGAVYAHLLPLVDNRQFPTSESIHVVAIAVIGGIGVLAGPLLGALYLVGIPGIFALDSMGQSLLQAGWLALILAYPSGLAGALAPARERLLRLLAARAGVAFEAEPVPVASPALALPVRAPRTPRREPLLRVHDVRKAYGGVTAVDGVSFEVFEGETLGLIGPNGAGKTTLFEIVSGFVRPDSGTVSFLGADVTSTTPEERGRLGLIRSFQEASLFPTLTVEETVMTAFERVEPSDLLSGLTGVRTAETAKAARARELLAVMGLEAYRTKQIAELSTGTRRICEIACLLALEPVLLLLDEPAAGVAQRETEALGGLIESVKEHLGTTLIVIEHDMPLINELAGRIIALESGRIIAQGDSDTVQSDSAVIEAFLGTDNLAVQRSGQRPT